MRTKQKVPAKRKRFCTICGRVISGKHFFMHRKMMCEKCFDFLRDAKPQWKFNGNLSQHGRKKKTGSDKTRTIIRIHEKTVVPQPQLQRPSPSVGLLGVVCALFIASVFVNGLRNRTTK